MFTADSIHMVGHPDRERRHIETLPLGFWGISQAKEVFSREAHLLPVAGKVPVHKVIGKHIVTSRHRCMGGKHRTLADGFASVRVRRSLLNQFANALQREEGGVDRKSTRLNSSHVA